MHFLNAMSNKRNIPVCPMLDSSTYDRMTTRGTDECARRGGYGIAARV